MDAIESEYKKAGGRPKFTIVNKILIGAVDFFEKEEYYGDKNFLVDRLIKMLVNNDVFKGLALYEEFLSSPKRFKDYFDYYEFSNILSGVEKYPFVDSPEEITEKFNAINNLDDLLEFADYVIKIDETLTKWEKQEKEFVLIEDTDKATIYKITSFYHACKFGLGTKWCTTRFDDYRNYDEVFDLFIIIPKDKEKQVYGDKITYEIKYQMALFKEEDRSLIEDDVLYYYMKFIGNQYKFTGEVPLNEIYGEDTIISEYFDIFDYGEVLNVIIDNYDYIKSIVNTYKKLKQTTIEELAEEYLKYIENNKELKDKDVLVSIYEFLDKNQLYIDDYSVIGRNLEFYDSISSELYSLLKIDRHDIKENFNYSEKNDNLLYKESFIEDFYYALSSFENKYQQADNNIYEFADNTNSRYPLEVALKYITDEALYNRVKDTIRLNNLLKKMSIKSASGLYDYVLNMVANGIYEFISYNREELSEIYSVFNEIEHNSPLVDINLAKQIKSVLDSKIQ
ncbi:MAG: hypothetical protein N3A54_00040 [Patescibacteria group bacterium]|nr:hypothetical protein [Patescibacteria group bacterium]